MNNTMAERVAGFGITIFGEMTRLAREHGAINLSQGFPDFPGPEEVKEAAVEAIRGDLNQYAISYGALSLRRAIAAKVARYNGLADVDSEGEITVTCGATEAIFASLMGLVNPGDEVILFEPFFDSYVPGVVMAGGQPRYVTLHPPHFSFDPEELKSTFGPRTKVIMLNTPHNPTGKVYSRDELTLIAELCQEWDVVAITDEVYEHIIFDGAEHVSLASLPGMRERTITANSTGKSFSMTGWKVGWAIAAPPLTEAIRRAHQFITFCGAAPLQEAMAVALGTDDDYYQELARFYTVRRDFLLEALRQAGFEVFVPQGTYYILTDISSFGFPNDEEFCMHLVKEVGVAAIPASFVYHHQELGQQLVRFAFCKKMESLETAVERLSKL
ncbi:MAG: methionine aminotransferase [Anaerolineae bacterium]